LFVQFSISAWIVHLGINKGLPDWEGLRKCHRDNFWKLFFIYWVEFQRVLGVNWKVTVGVDVGANGLWELRNVWSDMVMIVLRSCFAEVVSHFKMTSKWQC
jgi:hypothetical protein